jgi:hypothetical protein
MFSACQTLEDIFRRSYYRTSSTNQTKENIAINGFNLCSQKKIVSRDISS